MCLQLIGKLYSKNNFPTHSNNGFGIAVLLTEAGGKKLAEIIKENSGKIMGMVVDGKLVMAPVIGVPITGGEAFINGNFTLEEAERIASGVLGEK
jgi:SecD/SecF fusion protein